LYISEQMFNKQFSTSLTVETATGEVKAGSGKTLLTSSAIGSCIVMAAYDPERKAGCLAHIMLPGKCPDSKAAEKNRYAWDAIEELLEKMGEMGSNKSEFKVFLAGGGNVLKKSNDQICTANINSVLSILKERNIEITKKALGGDVRRRLLLDISGGTVYLGEGDGPEEIVWTQGVEKS